VHLSGTQVFSDVVNPEVSPLGALSIVQTGQLPGVLEGMPKVKNFATAGKHRGAFPDPLGAIADEDHHGVSRYRCPTCQHECRPLLDQLGVEPGCISGSLARILVMLAVVAPYPLAARLAWLLLGVKISPMGIWRVAQRLGEAAARYSDDLSRYHGDSRSAEAPAPLAPTTVVVGVDGCALGMQVRPQRRRRKAGEPRLPPLPVVEDGQFREVKTGVLLLPDERVESSPGRRSLVRRILVTCLGDADAIYGHLWAQLRELGWLRHLPNPGLLGLAPQNG